MSNGGPTRGVHTVTGELDAVAQLRARADEAERQTAEAWRDYLAAQTPYEYTQRFRRYQEAAYKAFVARQVAERLSSGEGVG